MTGSREYLCNRPCKRSDGGLHTRAYAAGLHTRASATGLHTRAFGPFRLRG